MMIIVGAETLEQDALVKLQSEGPANCFIAYEHKYCILTSVLKK